MDLRLTVFAIYFPYKEAFAALHGKEIFADYLSWLVKGIFNYLHVPAEVLPLCPRKNPTLYNISGVP